MEGERKRRGCKGKGVKRERQKLSLQKKDTERVQAESRWQAAGKGKLGAGMACLLNDRSGQQMLINTEAYRKRHILQRLVQANPSCFCISLLVQSEASRDPDLYPAYRPPTYVLEHIWVKQNCLGE